LISLASASGAANASSPAASAVTPAVCSADNSVNGSTRSVTAPPRGRLIFHVARQKPSISTVPVVPPRPGGSGTGPVKEGLHQPAHGQAIAGGDQVDRVPHQVRAHDGPLSQQRRPQRMRPLVRVSRAGPGRPSSPGATPPPPARSQPGAASAASGNPPWPAAMPVPAAERNLGAGCSRAASPGCGSRPGLGASRGS